MFEFEFAAAELTHQEQQKKELLHQISTQTVCYYYCQHY